MTEGFARKLLSIAAVGGVLALCAPATPAVAQTCADRSAREALEMRVLQSELMVAALTCNQRPSYNAFVTTFKPYLKAQGHQLRAYFTEAFGPTMGPKRLNNMVTRLANTASQNSLSQSTSAFCAQAKQRFDTVLSATPKALARLARANPTASVHGVKSCLEVAEGEPQLSDQN